MSQIFFDAFSGVLGVGLAFISLILICAVVYGGCTIAIEMIDAWTVTRKRARQT